MRVELSHYLTNTVWLFTGHTTRMGLVMLGAVLLARYLGPTSYGQYSFALAVVFVLQFLANLGLQPVLKKRYIESPESVSQDMGTALLLTMASGTLIYFLLITTLPIFFIDQNSTTLLRIMGLVLITDSFRCIDIWFQVETRAKLMVISYTIPAIIAVIAKISAIIMRADLIIFAQIHSIEFFCYGILLAWFYNRYDQPIRTLSPNLHTAKYLLQLSWPLILNGFAGGLLQRMDQVMLQVLSGNEAVGLFAASSRLSSVWYMVPVLLSSTLTPPILRARKVSHELYLKKIQLFMDSATLLAYLIAVIISVNSFWLIPFLFGKAYDGAFWILCIHIWGCIFMFQGVVRSIHVIGEGLFRFVLLSSLLSTSLNFLLNVLLIPVYEGVGAAFASVAAMFVSYIVLSYFHPRMRKIFWIQLHALLIPFRPREWVKYYRILKEEILP